MAYEISQEYATAKEVSDFLGLDYDDERELGADSGVSETYPDRLYVGASMVPLFTVGDPVRVWDTSNLVGEEANVESIGSDYVVLDANLVGDYTTVNFAKFMILSHFTKRSRPTRAKVDEWILQAQEDLDKRMRNTYLEDGRRHVRWFPFYPNWRNHYPQHKTYPFEYNDVRWVIRTEVAPLMPFDSDKGDHIYLYDGAEIIDLLDGSYTEWNEESTTARSECDFWVDYEIGDIFLRSKRPRYGEKAAKIVCRQGTRSLTFDEDTARGDYQTKVPADVHQATLMWVSINVLGMERYAFNTPSGGQEGQETVHERIRSYRKRIAEIINYNREMLFYGPNK